MPRLPLPLLKRAFNTHPLLVPLLRLHRTLAPASTELRWLSEHFPTPPSLRKAVHRRGAAHYPLQYLLQTVPFGRFELRVRRGVLIPRWETEEWAGRLARVVRGASVGGVLDVCTGSGCIAVTLADTGAHVEAVDISGRAIRLARENTARTHTAVTVRRADIFSDADMAGPSVDLLTANPPYVSREGWTHECERSVKRWEPSLALIADGDGDAFYGRIRRVAEMRGARAIVVEVGGREQARRVLQAWTMGGGWEGGVWDDSAHRGRCAVAWRKGGEWVKRFLAEGGVGAV